MSRRTILTDPKEQARRAAMLQALEEAWSYYTPPPPAPLRAGAYDDYPLR